VLLQEGIDYLKSEGKTKLLERQGLAEPEASKPGLQRDSTMAVTAKVLVPLPEFTLSCKWEKVLLPEVWFYFQRYENPSKA